MYNPHSFNDRLDRGWRCIEDEDWSSAASILQSALATDPHRKATRAGKAAALLGHVLLKLNDPNQAFSAFDEAMQINVRIPALRSARGMALLRAGMDNAAIDAFEDAVLWDRTLIPIQYDLGNLYLRTGNVAKSEAAYRAVLELDPSHLGTLTNLGDLLTRTNQLTEAIEVLRRAREVDPRSWEVNTNLALALAKAKCWTEAIDLLDWLARNFPECPRTRVLRARVLRCAGLGSVALPHLGESIDWGRWDAARYEILGLIHADRGNTDQALMFWSEAIALNPKMARVCVHAAEYHIKRQEWEQARQAIQKAVAIDSRRPASWIVHGRIDFAMNHLDLAAEAFQRCLMVDRKADEPHFWLGRIHLRRHDRRSAAASLGKLDQLESPWAAELRPFVDTT